MPNHTCYTCTLNSSHNHALLSLASTKFGFGDQVHGTLQPPSVQHRTQDRSQASFEGTMAAWDPWHTEHHHRHFLVEAFHYFSLVPAVLDPGQRKLIDATLAGHAMPWG